MAKISANKCHEVARSKNVITMSDGGLGTYVMNVTHVLRSDRVVLRKVDTSGYKRVGRVPAHVGNGDDLLAFFGRYVSRYVAARS